MPVERTFFNVLVDDLEASRRFYVDLFGFDVRFSSPWFVHLAMPDAPALELGLLRRDHETVPEAWRGRPSGGVLTITVDDVDALFARAQAAGLEVVQAPRDLFYGQRRMLLCDPAGMLVDVSSECAPAPEWMARVRDLGDGRYEES